VVNVIGTVVAAFGTLAAVGYSLWLTRRATKFRGKLWADVAHLLPGTSRFIRIHIVNTGDRVVKVTSVGWRFEPRRSKVLHWQKIDPDREVQQSPLPCVLSSGEDATWYVNTRGNQWFGDQMETLELRPKKVYVWAGFSDGNQHEVTISKGLLEEFQQGFDRSRIKPEQEVE